MLPALTRQLRELEMFDSIGAPVLTLYLPVDAGADLLMLGSRMVRMLAADLPEAAQADLARELELVRDYCGSLLARPRGLVIVSCRRRGYFRVVRLDEPVTAAAFWQPAPHTAMLRERVGPQAAAGSPASAV
jgi:hypothetical protein